MRGEVDVLNSLAAIEIDSGEAKIALEHAQKALEIAEEIDYPSGVSHPHHMLGVSWGHLGEYELAWKHLDTALWLNSRIGKPSSSLLPNIDELAIRQGNYEKAKAYVDEGFKLAEEAKDQWNMGAALGTRGWIALRQGELEQAKRLLGESLGVRQKIGDKGGIAWCLEKLAEIASIQGLPEKAARILGTASSLRQTSSSPINSADQPEYDRLLESVWESIGQERFQAAWGAGSMMPLETRTSND